MFGGFRIDRIGSNADGRESCDCDDAPPPPLLGALLLRVFEGGRSRRPVV